MATTDAHADRQNAGGSSIKVQNPLSAPYRTGSYLVYDITPASAKQPPASAKHPPASDKDPGGKDPEHFRSAWSLDTHPYPASGSHQLDAPRLMEILKSKVIEPYGPSELFLVDLREETHGFLNGKAASW